MTPARGRMGVGGRSLTRRRSEDSLLVGGLTGIFAVTLATLALAAAGAVIAIVVALLF